jgi:hypothetical protein
MAKHRGTKMCEVCEKRPVDSDGSAGLGGVLCIVCIYEL